MRRLGMIIAAALVLVAAGPAAASAAEKAGRPHLAPPPPGPRALARAGETLVGLDWARGARAEIALQAAGARLVSHSLGVWLLPAGAAARVLPALVADGAVRFVEPNRRLAALEGRFDAGDPLVPQEWWIQAVGADRAEPPGPGRPVTVIDTGIDATQPEFAGRPDVTLLNRQETTGADEEHGTAVSSVIGAPANGAGVVGIYPRAALVEWDAGGITIGELVAGLDAALASCPGVVNMSYGSEDSSPIEEAALLALFRAGCVLVAAAGNELQDGNPAEYPASYDHVLTVAASTREDRAADFSSSSLAVDLAAPGEAIPVAVPLSADPSGFALYDGTSFAAPLVSGATAWVWTARPKLDATQVFDLMRWAARDVGDPGWDSSTGFGILDVPAALARTAPAVDPQEPNDDVSEVVPHGLFRAGSRSLTDPHHRRRTLSARLDITEDPEDVYRVWVPAHRTIRARVTGNGDVDVQLWGPATTTVYARGRQRRTNLIDASSRAGTRPETVGATNNGRRGAFVFLDVFLRQDGPLNASYRVKITTSRR